MPPYGYRFKGDDRSVLFIDEEVKPFIRLIFDLRLSGESYSKIARIINKKGIETPSIYLTKKGYVLNFVVEQWSADMVKKVLENPIRAGVMVNHKTETKIVSSKTCSAVPKEQWICVPGMHEGIVSVEELEKVLSMVRKVKKQTKTSREKYIFAGKIRCGYCKKPLKLDFTCSSPRAFCRYGAIATDTLCYKGVYITEPLEGLVLQLIRAQAAMAEDTIKKIKSVNKSLNLPRLKKEMTDYEERIKNGQSIIMESYEEFATGKLTKEEFLIQKEKTILKELQYRRRIEELQLKITNEEERKAKEKNEVLKVFSKYIDLEALSYSIVQKLINVIYFYDPQHIEIVWNFKDEFLSITEGDRE